MITYIKGQLTEICEGFIVVEAYGVGYEITVPNSIFSALPFTGSDVKIYTYQNIREDANDLYGFLSRDDLNIFKMLIGVHGIGPKNALNILSAISPDNLRMAILSEDVKTIKSAPGIGLKGAQQIILELKDKLSLDDVLTSGAQLQGTVTGAGSVRDEAVEALVSLGYSSTEALKAVTGIEITESTDSETVLKAALKKLAFM